jgi:hypothetical protein
MKAKILSLLAAALSVFPTSALGSVITITIPGGVTTLPNNGITVFRGGGDISATLNPNVAQSRPIAPGAVNFLLSAWLVNIPDIEAIRLNTLTVDLSLTGSVEALLSLRSGGTTLGQFPVPGPASVFFLSPSFIIPQRSTADLRLFGDVLFGSAGTIQATLSSGSIHAIGATTFQAYSGPTSPLVGGIHQVGSVPEPVMTLPLIAGVGAVLFFGIKKKKW